MAKTKIRSFTGLHAWQTGHKLVLDIYETTKSFPKSEQIGLASQMRRCAVSITSNIAEGFSRSTRPEKKQFYAIAQGSTTELQNQLLIARDVSYIVDEDFQRLAEQTIQTHKLTNGLIKTARSKDT